MTTLNKAGGISALLMALSYIVGIVVFVTVLNTEGSLNLTQQVEFLIANQSIIYFTMLFIYVFAGFALLVLVQALYEVLKTKHKTLMQTTAVIGLIWSGVVIAAGMIYLVGMDSVIELNDTQSSQAASLWQSVQVISNGLGGGTEIVGGIWIALISWTALGSNIFPKVLNYLGLIVGLAGIVTIIPTLKDATMVFGLGQILWFIWVGVALLKRANN